MLKQSLRKFLSFAQTIIESFENEKFLGIELNRNLGIIYTPNQVVDYIVSNVFRIYFEELLKIRNLEKINNNLLSREIKNIKILDPACGSGRFLVSAANKLYSVYKNLNSEQGEYALRKKIIEKHLFGIEIEKAACTISKLRLIFWLFSKNIKNIPISDLNINNLKFQNLDRIIKGFNLKFNIYNLDYLLDFNSNQINGGFHIIIGNPPYIENKKIKDRIYKTKLIQKFKSTYRLFDISIVFIEKSLELLKQNQGCLSFLTTNKMLSADYGIKIRDIIVNNTILKEIINISSIPIFKKISAYPIIISLIKKKPDRDNSVSIKKFNRLQDMNKNDVIDLKKILQFSIRSLPTNTIPISGNLNLLNYLYENFKPMDKVIDDLRIVYRPFGFLDYSKYFDNISERKESENDLLLIGTGNVGKYHIKFNKHIRIAKRDLKISYFKYIPKFEKIWNIMLGEKLLFREIAKDLTLVYDPGLYTNITGLYSLSIPSFSTDNLFSLLAIMNSDIINLTFKSLFSSLHLSGGYLRFNGSFIKRLPIPQELPPSLSYLGKIIQILSQLYYDLNSTDLKVFNNSLLNQLKKNKYRKINIILNFYKALTNSLVSLLYFEELYLKSNNKFNLIYELLTKKDSIPNLQFKYIIPRFKLSKFETYQNEELNIAFSKITNFYKILSQNNRLISQMEKISYNNLTLRE